MSEYLDPGPGGTGTGGPSREALGRYHRDLARFRKRKRIALIVSVACNVVAVALIALGVALVLGSLGSISGEYLADRHAPGESGSISLPRDGRYAITRGDEPVPPCTVTTLDGDPVTVTTDVVPRTDETVQAFDATKGRYLVACDGGQEGIVVFDMAQMDLVANGWLFLTLRALPFIALGLVAFLLGRFLPRRMVPESLRPMIPG